MGSPPRGASPSKGTGSDGGCPKELKERSLTVPADVRAPPGVPQGTEGTLPPSGAPCFKERPPPPYQTGRNRYAAEEAARQRKQMEVIGRPRGRPKKTEAELLSEATRTVRDKRRLITDLAADEERKLAELEAEMKETFKTIPSDVELVHDAMVDAVEKSVSAIKKIEAEVAKVDVSKLAEEGDNDEKKKLATLINPIRGEHLKAISKAVAAFRKAIVAATKKKRRVDSKEALQETSKPIFLDVLNEVTVTNGGNVKNSVKDCMLGKGAAEMICGDLSMTKSLDAIPAFQSQLKYTKKVMSKGSCSHTMNHFKSQGLKPMDQLLKKSLEDGYNGSVKFPPSHQGLHRELFNVQAWSCTEFHKYIGYCPFGLGEARLLYSGSYWICGVKACHVRGDHTYCR